MTLLLLFAGPVGLGWFLQGFTEIPEELWSAVLTRKGGSYALIARMPPDPSVN